MTLGKPPQACYWDMSNAVYVYGVEPEVVTVMRYRENQCKSGAISKC